MKPGILKGLSWLPKTFITLGYMLCDVETEKIINIKTAKLNSIIWMIGSTYIVEEFFYGITRAMSVLGTVNIFGGTSIKLHPFIAKGQW